MAFILLVDGFDVTPYVKRVEDAQMYNLAAKLLSTSGTDLYFKGPTQFTYRIEPVLQKNEGRRTRPSGFSSSHHRSVVVVALRNHHLRVFIRLLKLEGCTVPHYCMSQQVLKCGNTVLETNGKWREKKS